MKIKQNLKDKLIFTAICTIPASWPIGKYLLPTFEDWLVIFFGMNVNTDIFGEPVARADIAFLLGFLFSLIFLASFMLFILREEYTPKDKMERYDRSFVKLVTMAGIGFFILTAIVVFFPNQVQGLINDWRPRKEATSPHKKKTETGYPRKDRDKLDKMISQ